MARRRAQVAAQRVAITASADIVEAEIVDELSRVRMEDRLTGLQKEKNLAGKGKHPRPPDRGCGLVLLCAVR